jgi:hypothetical protein
MAVSADGFENVTMEEAGWERMQPEEYLLEHLDAMDPYVVGRLICKALVTLYRFLIH